MNVEEIKKNDSGWSLKLSISSISTENIAAIVLALGSMAMFYPLINADTSFLNPKMNQVFIGISKLSVALFASGIIISFMIAILMKTRVEPSKVIIPPILWASVLGYIGKNGQAHLEAFKSFYIDLDSPTLFSFEVFWIAAGGGIFLLAILAFLYLVYLTFTAATKSYDGFLEDVAKLSPSTVVYDRDRGLSENDKLRVASHEAGHALLLAAFGENLSKNVEVKVGIGSYKKGMETIYFVGNTFHDADFSKDQVLTSAYLEWHMLLLLAGSYHENRTLPTESIIGTNDYTTWLYEAKKYLSMMFKDSAYAIEGIYYPSPTNMQELQSNDEKLIVLRNKQFETLDLIFDLNKGPLDLMVMKLIEKGTLTYSDIKPILDEVVFPEGFAIPEVFLK